MVLGEHTRKSRFKEKIQLRLGNEVSIRSPTKDVEVIFEYARHIQIFFLWKISRLKILIWEF